MLIHNNYYYNSSISNLSYTSNSIYNLFSIIYYYNSSISNSISNLFSIIYYVFYINNI